MAADETSLPSAPLSATKVTAYDFLKDALMLIFHLDTYHLILYFYSKLMIIYTKILNSYYPLFQREISIKKLQPDINCRVIIFFNKAYLLTRSVTVYCGINTPFVTDERLHFRLTLQKCYSLN